MCLTPKATLLYQQCLYAFGYSPSPLYTVYTLSIEHSPRLAINYTCSWRMWSRNLHVPYNTQNYTLTLNIIISHLVTAHDLNSCICSCILLVNWWPNDLSVGYIEFEKAYREAMSHAGTHNHFLAGTAIGLGDEVRRGWGEETGWLNSCLMFYATVNCGVTHVLWPNDGSRCYMHACMWTMFRGVIQFTLSVKELKVVTTCTVCIFMFLFDQKHFSYRVRAIVH